MIFDDYIKYITHIYDIKKICVGDIVGVRTAHVYSYGSYSGYSYHVYICSTIVDGAYIFTNIKYKHEIIHIRKLRNTSLILDGYFTNKNVIRKFKLERLLKK